MPKTRSPRARRASQRCEPMKPAAPVTKTVRGNRFLRRFLFPRYANDTAEQGRSRELPWDGGRSREIAQSAMPLSPEWLDREEGDGKEYLLRRHSQVVRQRTANPLSPGSNPGAASTPSSARRRRVGPPLHLWYLSSGSPGGGTGRRTGLKIPRPRGRGGSIPPPGTSTAVRLR